MTTPARLLCLLLQLSTMALLPSRVHAWGQPHLAITKAGLDVLPAWQKDLLGADLPLLASNYCLIPDNVYTDKENAKFAAMDSHPGEVYLKKLHLPVPDQRENRESVRYFMDKAVSALQAGRTSDAAKFMGTLCHVIEDFGSPAHTVPGDNQFTFLQQFMPPPEKMKDKLLHGPIENGTFTVTLGDYAPKLLGISVEEASWRLLHRIHEGIINARSTTVPIIQALYANDADEVTRHQLRAATLEAQIVADAIHTIVCLGTKKFDSAAQEPIRNVGIATFWPIEAENLFYPQSHFFSSPYWGHARVGSVLEGGVKSVRLKLRVQEKDTVIEKPFADAISSGVGKPLSWHLPKGTYRRFTVLSGLHSELGAKGRVEFTVLGDGKPLATAIVNGPDPAHVFDCDITGVSQLQLTTTSRGLDPKSNYAIWAEPTLLKTDR